MNEGRLASSRSDGRRAEGRRLWSSRTSFTTLPGRTRISTAATSRPSSTRCWARSPPRWRGATGSNCAVSVCVLDQASLSAHWAQSAHWHECVGRREVFAVLRDRQGNARATEQGIAAPPSSPGLTRRSSSHVVLRQRRAASWRAENFVEQRCGRFCCSAGGCQGADPIFVRQSVASPSSAVTARGS